MTFAFRKALSKLNLEHSLGLFDPDLADHPIGNHADYQLCRAVKDLWQENPSRLSRVIDQFDAQTRDFRFQWAIKPNGDLTTLPGDAGKQIKILKGLLRQLLAEEDARFVPPPSTRFLISNEQEMLFAADDDHDQNLAGPSSVAPFANLPCSNSSDMVPPPDSSWIRELEYQEHIIMADAGQDHFVPMDGDHMVLDLKDQSDLSPAHRHIPVPTKNKTTVAIVEDSAAKKRPASLHETEKHHGPRSFNGAQLQNAISGGPVFSFTKPQESFTSNGARNTSAYATTANTSFRSVATELNESFITNVTPPSSHSSGSHEIRRSITPTAPQANTVELSDRARGYLDRFIETSPFDSFMHACPKYLSFSTTYEVQRVALHCDLHVTDVAESIRRQPGLFDNAGQVTDLSRLWAVLSRYVDKQEGSMPPKSSEEAWRAFSTSRKEFQFSRICLTGAVSFRDKPKNSEPLLEMKLHPLFLEHSNRLKRKYGGDRVMVLDFPSLEASDLPEHLKHDAADMRLAFIEWLSTSSHYLLGQEWRAFYVKSKSRSKSSEKRAFGWKVYFFAVNGHGFKEYDDNNRPQRHSIDHMLNWYFSVSDNQDQPLLKLFSRLQLLISDTIPSITFEHDQIIQQDDMYCQGVLMTDGCARISLKAAQAISAALNLPLPIPSAFQGRIAGAKGMWIVDTNLAPRNGSDIWIEMLPSQTKFNGLSRDEKYPDKYRMTFEVNNYSRPLRPAPVNFQLLPILIDRNVKAKVFMKLLKADLDTKVAELGAAMSQPQALRSWNQEQYPAGSARLASNGVVWEGGMPKQDEEQINALIEAGFHPKTCSHLRKLCMEAVKTYCMRVEEKMNIYPGQTTFAYMVPDFWGVLEEDQIHMGFSSAFTDKRQQWSDTMLHSIDVLVARLPAVLPSDIHKVRAVFKTELAHLKDVIVFPTKGSFCLADKLSGGDYDGDRAWICWNSSVVESFQNFKTPPKKDHSHYGIKKDTTRVGDVWKLSGAKEPGGISRQAEQATQFIKQGLEFNMRRSMLGRCSLLHEAYCYHLVLKASKRLSNGKFYSPMRVSEAIELAHLLGYLVDTAKSGFTFTDGDCDAYLKSAGIPRRIDAPAYKTKDKDSADHIIDKLVLDTATEFRKAAMIELGFTTDALAEGPKDMDLTKAYQHEKALAEKSKDQALSLVFQQLQRDIAGIYDRWSQLSTRAINSEMPWSQINKTVRTLFLDLQPASGVQSGLNLDAHPLIQRWQESRKHDGFYSLQSWYLLAASAFYTKYARGTLVWRSCGKELLQLKLLANNDGVSVTRQMHQYMKFDNKMWNNAKLRGSDGIGTDIATDIGAVDVDEFIAFDAESMYDFRADWE